MLLIFVCLSHLVVTGGGNKAGFIYITQPTDQKTELNLYHFHDSSLISIELPSINFHNISPSKPLVVFTDEFGMIYILDLITQEIVSLDIQIVNNIELVYGSHQQKSGSLRWSPNGEILAFVGYSNEDLANIFVYHVETGELDVVNQDLQFIDNLVDITSWSPDSEFLTIVGRWFTQEDNQSNLPAFRSALIATEGSLYSELGNEQRTCEVYWSSDQDYLVSETGCFENQVVDTPLLIFGFDEVDMTPNQQSSLQLSSNFDDTNIRMIYPQWLDNNTLAFVALTSKRGVNLSSNSPISEIVQYDLLTDTYKPMPNSEVDFTWQTSDMGYVFSIVNDSESLYHLTGYNLMDQSYFNLVQYTDLCPASNVNVSSNGNLVSVLRGCSLNSLPIIELIDIRANEIIFDVVTPKGILLKPLGFFDFD